VKLVVSQARVLLQALKQNSARLTTYFLSVQQCTEDGRLVATLSRTTKWQYCHHISDLRGADNGADVIASKHAPTVAGSNLNRQSSCMPLTSSSLGA
jgi:hypothetical protein